MKAELVSFQVSIAIFLTKKSPNLPVYLLQNPKKNILTVADFWVTSKWVELENFWPWVRPKMGAELDAKRTKKIPEVVQYHSFIWKRLFLDTWQHHRVMPLNTQLIAIEKNPKPFLLSKIIHLFQNCLHLKKIVTFLYNFGHHKHFPPKFQILVV